MKRKNTIDSQQRWNKIDLKKMEQIKRIAAKKIKKKTKSYEKPKEIE